MIPKAMDQIVKADIELLISEKAREGLTMEYKSKLPDNSDRGKRSFMADVSSFANAAGGDLIYGIEAKDGVPINAVGLDCNCGAEKLRLENILEHGLEPKVQGIRMREVPGFDKPVLLLRIPRSWNGPHMIVCSNRFYTRNSAGNHQMVTSEIRSAFLVSEAMSVKIKRFRDDRLAQIVAGETPVPLDGSAKLILHVIPAIFLTGDYVLDNPALDQHSQKFWPIESGGWEQRFNIDGVVNFGGQQYSGSNGYHSYCQIYRKGAIESVWANLTSNREGVSWMPSVAYERYVIEAVNQYIKGMIVLNVPCPIFVQMSLTGVKGVCMHIREGYPYRYPIDRDTLLLPDVWVEEYQTLADFDNTAKALRPVFDAVWNACGHRHSLNYNEEGKWVGS